MDFGGRMAERRNQTLFAPFHLGSSQLGRIEVDQHPNPYAPIRFNACVPLLTGRYAQHRVPYRKPILVKFKAITGADYSSATRTISAAWNLVFVSSSNPKVSLTPPDNRFYLGCGRIRRVAVEANASGTV
jgi:hypothetical protein